MGQLLSALALVGASLIASIIIYGSNSNADQAMTSPQTTAQALPTVAGVPRDKAQAIFERHRKNLLSMPGVYEVGLGDDGILLAVFVHSNSREIDPQALQKAVAALPVTVEGIPTKVLPLAILPPPPGVVILRADGTREQADTCPEGFREMKRFSWQLCIDPGFTEPIPALMEPPIAGIPHEKVLEIHERHVEALSKLPGVGMVGLGAEGIHVYTDKPELVPKEVEGVPIKVFPHPGPGREANHTVTGQVRPVHGSVAILDYAWILTTPLGRGTLTGVALSEGKPWLIFPAHLISQCQDAQSITCPIPSQGGPSVLNNCAPHYGNRRMVQPPEQNYEITGYTQRWAAPVARSVGASLDIAAAFMDNNMTEGDGSLSANRTLEHSIFTGNEIVPMVGDTVVVASHQDLGGVSHVFFARVDLLSGTADPITSYCGPGSTLQTRRVNQIILEQIPGQRFIVGGDSGSPILAQNSIVGMVNWKWDTGSPQIGGGNRANTIKANLGFDAWYGTQTVNDNTIGVFRPSSASWYIDNGNGKYEGCTSAVPTATRDQCFGNYGFGTDVPITGDWDDGLANGVPTNDVTLGVYRPTDNPTTFWLSNTNTSFTSGGYIYGGPASSGNRPVTGKWPGVNGTTKIGVFQPGTAGWFLDGGNQVIEACGTDYCFSLAAGMYQSEDIPIAGDWNNDGIVSIGLFRRGVGGAPDYFFLSNVNPFSVRNNGTISTWNYSVNTGAAGLGYLPVVGNWTGTVGTKLGTYRSNAGSSSGGWYLDNGNRSFPGCSEDQCPNYFGTAGDKPLAFGKSLVRGN